MAFSLGQLLVEIGADLSGIRDAQREIDRTGTRMQKVFFRVGVAIATAFSLDAATKMIKIADSLNVMERRIQRLVGTARDADKAMRRLTDTANAAGVEVKTVTTIFERFANIRKEIGASKEEIFQLTDTLAKLGKIGGSSAEEIRRALVQLSQGLAGGVLRAEEFNSIVEQTPEVLRAIARESGRTFGQLRGDMLEGKLTSDVVFDAILASAEKTNEEFEKIPKTVTQLTQALTNELSVAIKNLDESLGASSGLANFISGFTRLARISNDVAAVERETARRMTAINGILEKRTELSEAELARAARGLKLQKENADIQDILAGLDEKRDAKHIAKLKGVIGANEIILKQIREQSAITAEVLDIQSGKTSLPGEDIEEEVVEPVKSLTKAQQTRIAKILQFGETEREAIARVALENREFILSLEGITMDQRLELLEAGSNEKKRLLKELAADEASIQDKADKKSRKKREKEQKQSIDAMETTAGAISGIVARSGNDRAQQFGKIIQDVTALATTIIGISQAQAMAQTASGPDAPTLGQKIANVSVMAGLFSSIFSTLRSAKGGGRQFGGGASPHLAHPVNEAGVPEVLTQGANQYLLPNGKGGNITPLSNGGGMGGSGLKLIINNNAPVDVSVQSITSEEVSLMISKKIAQNNKQVQGDLATGRGETSNALTKGHRVSRRLG